MKRVVITGMAALTSLGNDWQTFSDNLKQNKSAIQIMDDWAVYKELNTRLAAPIHDFKTPSHFSRKQTRSMGRVALLATAATETALQQAQLLGDPCLVSGNTGVSYGSSTGSPDAVKDFAGMLVSQDMSSITATTYLRLMSHTCAVNIGIFFGLKGRVFTTSSACTSGSQGIGQAFEAIKFGKQTVMLAGGAEELCASEAAVFDTLYATSQFNDQPDKSPRPFDKDRDGLVIGEGAATLVLEELEHAQARGATIYAEVVGYASNSDGGHVTQPSHDTMAIAMQLALDDAELPSSAIGYINAHGTATERGDIAESTATYDVFGGNTPISSLKGNIGHTLGACGAIESWASINMLNEGNFYPTLNLHEPDERCAKIDYIIGQPRQSDCEFVMSNNFAFGGINTSLIFRRWS